MNQNERLLDYLKANGAIDPMTAWERLGIYRLASRVHELRISGCKISKTPKKVRNRFGEKCSVLLYALEKNNV